MKSRETLRVRYKNSDLIPLEKIIVGDWIDVRAAEDVKMKAGEFKLIDLGFAMQLPPGHEAYLLPRSSTYKNFGIIMANSMGVIDNSFCGNDDIWKFPAIALRDTEIHFNDRIAQFRIMESMKTIFITDFIEFSNKSRGGFGTTGIK